jgi:hypothetical protein
VGNLSAEVTDPYLKQAFEHIGECSDARVMWDHSTGRSKGFGFVSFRYGLGKPSFTFADCSCASLFSGSLGLLFLEGSVHALMLVILHMCFCVLHCANTF